MLSFITLHTGIKLNIVGWISINLMRTIGGSYYEIMSFQSSPYPFLFSSYWAISWQALFRVHLFILLLVYHRLNDFLPRSQNLQRILHFLPRRWNELCFFKWRWKWILRLIPWTAFCFTRSAWSGLDPLLRACFPQAAGPPYHSSLLLWLSGLWSWSVSTALGFESRC